MKKFLFLNFILIFILVGCKDDISHNISSEYILKNITDVISFQNPKEEDLKKQSVAERYGIAVDDIENGVVYYTQDENSSDKIIIAKAKEKEKVENIERALSSEVVGLTDSWKNDEKESKKIENHIFKTKDIYVILAISDEAKEITKIFDDCFK